MKTKKAMRECNGELFCGVCGKQFGYNEPSWFDEKQGDKYHTCDDCIPNEEEL